MSRKTKLNRYRKKKLNEQKLNLEILRKTKRVRYCVGTRISDIDLNPVYVSHYITEGNRESRRLLSELELSEDGLTEKR